MKFTNYFLHTREREDRKIIKLEWIKFVFNNPEKVEIQSDGRIRKWAKIEIKDKYLRIIVRVNQKKIYKLSLVSACN